MEVNSAMGETKLMRMTVEPEFRILGLTFNLKIASKFKIRGYCEVYAHRCLDFCFRR